jgi:hypothetical protein
MGFGETYPLPFSARLRARCIQILSCLAVMNKNLNQFQKLNTLKNKKG